MNVLRKVIDKWGFMDRCEIKEIAKSFPLAKVCIKWGRMPKEMIPIQYAIGRIDNVVIEGKDYLRDVFFLSEDLDALKQVLGNYE